MNKWDNRFISIAKIVSTWSTCLHRNIGAVIVKDKRIIATGYNGAPSNIQTCKDKNNCARKDVPSAKCQELCYAAHAEQNALLQAARLGISVEGCTMYCTAKPCSICAKMIINSGIIRVVYLNDYPDELSDKLFEESKLVKIEKFVDTTGLDVMSELSKELPNLNDKLTALNFYNAPCSTKYHLAFKGGLALHSNNVAVALKEFTDREQLKWQKTRSPLLIGMLHDLCKCDQYIVEGDFIKWNSSADSRHGEKSVEIAQMIVPDLTDEEAMCIKYHMGAFTDKEQWSNYGNAIKQYSNVLWTHQADMYATYIMEGNK